MLIFAALYHTYQMAEQSLKDKTAKGLFWGGVSNGVQQLLNLLFGIFLARLLSPSDYGMVGMLLIFSQIASTLQECGFTVALANKKEFCHEDYNAVFWFSFFMAAVMYILLFFSAPLIAQFYNEPKLIPLSRFLFIGFAIASLGTAHSAELFKRLKVKQKAISQIIALIMSGLVGIVMAYNGLAYWGIAAQNVVYVTMVNLCYWLFSPWRPTFNFDFRPIKEMFGFSSKILITNVFTQLNGNIFSVLLGKYFTVREVGYYTQASKWNGMAHSFITGMVSGVAQPVLAEVADDIDRQRNVFRKMLRFTAFVSCPAMLGLALVAKEIIIIAVTDKWLPSVSMLQILCVWGVFAPIAVLYSNLVLSRGNSNIFMWLTILVCILQLSVLSMTYIFGVRVMLVIYVIINMLSLLVWTYFVWRLIRLSLWDAMKDVFPFLFFATLTMLCSYYLTMNISSMYLSLIAKIIIAVILYVSFMWMCRATVFKESVKYIFKK